MFKVSPQQLKDLINAAKQQSDILTLGDLGVAKNIIQQIRANLNNGLNKDDLQQRRNHFGSNRKLGLESMPIGQAFRRSFFKFSWLFCQLLSGFAFLLNCASTNWKYSNQWIESIVIQTLIWSNMIIIIFQLRNNDKLEKVKLQIKEQQKQEGGAITGKLDQIKKTQIDLQKTQLLNFKEIIVLSLSTVISGNGKYVVLTFGPNSIYNSIQELTQDDNDNQEGFLQSQTIQLQKKIQKFGFLYSILVILLLFDRYIITYNEVNAFTTFSNILNLIIVLLSANISDALSIHFTVQLSQTVQNIMKSNNLVRNFKCLEQLAYMNKLILEITGVFTQNKMKLELFWNENKFEINQLQFNQFPKDFQKVLFQCCHLNNAIYHKLGNYSPTEEETYKIFLQFGVISEDEVTTFIPFTLYRKQIATILNNNRVVARGAYEFILNSCSHFHSLSQGIVEIDKTKNKTQFNKFITQKMMVEHQHQHIEILIWHRSIYKK